MSTYEEDAKYLLLIDGIRWAWVTHEDVDDAYVATLGFERAYPGLRIPDSLACGTEPRTGMLDSSSASFIVEDIDDTLPSVLASPIDDSEPLILRLSAGTTAVVASLYGKCVGIETMGDAGERRRFSCVPGYHVGLEHISANQADATGLGAAPVSDVPVIWAGRRACLYRLERTESGGWPDLTDASSRNATRIWWGTMLDQGTVEEKIWTLRFAGHDWHSRTLGDGVTQEGYGVDVGVTLDEDAYEHVLVGWVDAINVYTDSTAEEITAQKTDDTSLAGAASYAEIADGVDTFLQALAADAGLGTALSSIGNSTLRYTATINDGVKVRWDRPAHVEIFGPTSSEVALRVKLLASRKVLKVLGYDPDTQPYVDPLDAEKYCEFRSSPLDIDYPDHQLGIFWSCTPFVLGRREEGAGVSGSVEDWPEAYNFGNDRRWPPIYAGGCNVFDLAGLQEFELRGSIAESVFLSSNSARPLPADPDDASSPYSISGVGEVTHQGLAVFSGPFRDETDPEAEPTSISLVARVAWRQTTTGEVASANALYPRLVVIGWPDPRLYGLTDSLPSLWATWRLPPDDGEPLRLRPLMALEHGVGPDVAAYELVRMLVSTGSKGGWYTDDTLATPAYGFAPGAVLDVGANDLGLDGVGPELLGRFTDAEVSTFSMGVPAEMIATGEQPGSFQTTLIETQDSDLHRCKIALGKLASANDVFKSVLSPLGLCMSLAGGRYGLFDPTRFSPPSEDTGVITSEDLAGKHDDPRSATPKQDLRKWSPIDRVELKARLNPIKGDFARNETLRSMDPGAIYRPQAIVQRVDGSHLVHPDLTLAGSSWRTEWYARWREVTRFWAVKHFQVTVPLSLRRHAEFWPGAPMSLTNEWLVNPAGAVYGITQAPGYVIKRVLMPRTAEMSVVALVSAKLLRLYAPAAKATEYRADTDGEGFRIFVEDDFMGIRASSGTYDVQGFVEPAWSNVGGNPSIEVWSFDGVTWVGGVYGTIEAINVEAGNCWIKLFSAVSGTWYRDQHHVITLREATAQNAAWPASVYAPIGDEDGNWVDTTKTPFFTE